MKSFVKFLDQSALSVFLLVLSDLFWMSVAFCGAYYVRNNLFDSTIQPFSVYSQAIPFVGLMLIGTFYFFGLYERSRRTTQISELYNLVRAITSIWILIMAASFLYKYDYSRIFVIVFYGFSLITLNLGRFLVRALHRNLYRKGIGVTRVIIIGAGKAGKQIAEKLKSYDEFGYRVIGFVDDGLQNGIDSKILGQSQDLLHLIKKYEVQEIFVADPHLSHEQILELIHRCDQSDVKIKIVSNLFEIVTGDIDLNELEGLPSLNLAKQRSSFFYRFTKRIMDIVISLLALILLSPLWFLTMIAIQLESKGPALFIHERVGKNGKIFKIIKFRTMFTQADPNDYAPKTQKDARVTRVGRWLRKTSIDEIPQFINVLKGEMSIVGPRPEMPFIVEKYTDWQRHRLEVKPGITGLWQILGRKDLPLHENIEYDFYYIKNRSLLLDLIIILKTIAVVLRGKGAY